MGTPSLQRLGEGTIVRGVFVVFEIPRKSKLRPLGKQCRLSNCGYTLWSQCTLSVHSSVEGGVLQSSQLSFVMWVSSYMQKPQATITAILSKAFEYLIQKD